MTDLEYDGPVCAATSCTRPAAPAAVLCDADVRRLGEYLAGIGTEYERLSAVPSMQGREVGTIGGGRLASQRSPGNTHVMTIRDRRRGTGRIGYDDADPWGWDDTPSVLATLSSWADRVREGRELPEQVSYVGACITSCHHLPCRTGIGRAVRAPLTVARERALLAEKNNFRWILLQDWAGEFHDELKALWVTVRSANGPTERGRVRRMDAPCRACGVRAVTHRSPDELMECQSCKATQPYASDQERMSA